LAAIGVTKRLAPIDGDSQTDFVPSRVTKASGLTALLEHLGPTPLSRRPLALAVGDGVADLPMFDLAQLSLAPSNAAPAVRRAGPEILNAAYQTGLAAAAGRLIGHPAGACPRCRVPEPGAGTRRLVSLLSVQEAGGGGMPVRLARLAAMAAHPQGRS
jgi:hypothetical protein